MNFFFNIFKGICIGSGAILPGISSGVLCVVFGIYEKLLNSVLDFFKSPKENLKFLFPIFIGTLIGILAFSNILNYVLYMFPIQTKALFIGLILASIPSLLKEVNTKYIFKVHYFLYTLFAFFIGVFSVLLENHLSISNYTNINFFYLLFAGFFMSVGIIVPGVSSTIILMLFRIYPIYLSSISSLYFPILIPIGIGIILGSLTFMIIGFTLGSIFVLIPKMNFGSDLLIFILCVSTGFILIK